MRKINNNYKEVLPHYISFVLKSATLVMFLPVAEIFANPYELKFTALLLNMMYLILAIEFGFSIQISRVVGDHTDEKGVRNNIQKISKISSRIFLVLVLISLLVSIIYFIFNYKHLVYIEDAKIIFIIAISIFNLQLYSTKSYALCMGTVFLQNVKKMEAILYFFAFCVYFMNVYNFKSWHLHISIFLCVSVMRSISLFMIERRMKNISPNENNQIVDVKQFVHESYRIGFATAATQLFINTFLSKIYQISDVRTANDMNIAARLIQGVIIGTRQFTDLRFYQTSRDILRTSNLRLKILKKNLFYGVLLIFILAFISSYSLHQIKLNNSEYYALLFEQTAFLAIIFSVIYSIGLVSQQLLLVNVFIHLTIGVVHLIALLGLFTSASLLDVSKIALYYSVIFIFCLTKTILIIKKREKAK